MFVIVVQRSAQLDVIGPFPSRAEADAHLEKDGWYRDRTGYSDDDEQTSWRRYPKGHIRDWTAEVCEALSSFEQMS